MKCEPLRGLAAPEAARRVATFLREPGEAWAHSAHALTRRSSAKASSPWPGRPLRKEVRVGDGKRRVLGVRLTALRSAMFPIRSQLRPQILLKPDRAKSHISMEDPGLSDSPLVPGVMRSGGRYPRSSFLGSDSLQSLLAHTES
jgi:hypothetical protein